MSEAFALTIEAVSTAEKSFNYYQTTGQNISKDCHFGFKAEKQQR
jgi:hypothetical protein